MPTAIQSLYYSFSS